MNNNNAGISNLFALLDDAETPVRRIPLHEDFRKELMDLFDTQKEAMLFNKQEIEFDGSYSVDSSEIFAIVDFPLPDKISNAIQNPLNCPLLNLKEEKHKIKAIFTGKWTTQTKEVNFQVFDTGKLLTKGFTLIGSGENYKKLQEPGLILQEKLTAQYSNGKLLFNSYHNTRRFLSLGQYYTAATDNDLDSFAENEIFEFEDQSTFKANADAIIRKKIALLQKNNVLDGITTDEIKSVADDLNQHVAEEHRISIMTNDGKLIIPKDKKELKELIRFLDEDYVTAPITKRRCLTNSKKYL
ncbi:DUF4868 domain-containing protein [Candidatus Dojkabacteria bacterium]|nr:DUF4868 domain-containing protein [Candidatus Dojkabacteria bacterium]